MPDMESLNRAVEEARVRASYWPKLLPLDDEQAERAQRDLLAFEAAVSERARAEERGRAEESFKPLAEEYRRIVARNARPPFERARSSEEAGNGS